MPSTSTISVAIASMWSQQQTPRGGTWSTSATSLVTVWDWPRVWLCKHVSAVEHHFGNNDQQMGAMEDSLLKMPPPKQETLLDRHSTAGSTTASILQNVISVFKGALDNGVPSSTETVQSLRAIEAHLMAVVRSTRSTESPVPDKEEVPPNQRGSAWAKTTKQMG